MPNQPLPTIYTTPNNVFDYLGTEGAMLCLDDHQQATGQIIMATAGAGVGANSIPITALVSPLLAGDTLVFDGGGMPAVSQVTLASTASLGATSLSVVPLAVAVNSQAEATDTGVNLALAQRLLQGCYFGTDQVNLYCQGKYDPSQLVLSWITTKWATALAGRWLRRRRGQPAPKSVEEDAKEALDEMKQVNVGIFRIPNIGMRTSGWPFVTNVTVDLRYDYAKIRVETPLSEGTPTQYPQRVDWNSLLWLEW